MWGAVDARIIVIDNDDRIRDLFTTSLKKEGWQVFNFAYAQIDLAAVEQYHPDLIILDFNLRDDGIGWAFLQLLKMDDTTAKIPILITTTAIHLSADIQDYLVTRYIRVVRKPFDLNAVLTLIRKTLTEARQAGALFSGDRTLPILVVDDAEDLRDTIIEVLRLEGYRVVTAYNGLMALDTVSGADYCLILLDLAMPVMNGYEFLIAYDQQLRPHIPVIILSAEAKIDFHVLPTFVVDVLPKPFFIGRLLEVVSKYAEPVWGRQAKYDEKGYNEICKRVVR